MKLTTWHFCLVDRSIIEGGVTINAAVAPITTAQNAIATAFEVCLGIDVRVQSKILWVLTECNSCQSQPMSHFIEA